MMMFYAFTLVARDHFQNFPDYNSSQEQGHGISLAFMRDLDTQLQGLVAKNDGLLFALTIVVLIIIVTLVGSILWKAAVIKNHIQQKEVDSDDEKTEIVNTMLCMLLVSIKTFLHLPLFDIVLRTL